MPEETEQLRQNLVKKLAEACNEVGGVEKSGRNQAQGYNYVKAADVAKAIRKELFSRGIVIIPNEVSCEFVEFTTNKGTIMRECRLCTEYQISDGLTMLPFKGWGVAMDSGDKAIYKAKTGALKYFLRGLGLIPDEKDDPEHDGEVSEMTKEALTRPIANEDEPKPTDRLSQTQIKGIREAFTNNGKGSMHEIEYLSKLGVTQWEHLTRAQFNDAIQWAYTKPQPAQDLAQRGKDTLTLMEARTPAKTPANGSSGCPECGSKVVPAGESKKTGKKYAAFCSNANCPTRQKAYKKPPVPELLPAEDFATPVDADVPF